MFHTVCVCAKWFALFDSFPSDRKKRLHPLNLGTFLEIQTLYCHFVFHSHPIWDSQWWIWVAFVILGEQNQYRPRNLAQVALKFVRTKMFHDIRNVKVPVWLAVREGRKCHFHLCRLQPQNGSAGSASVVNQNCCKWRASVCFSVPQTLSFKLPGSRRLLHNEKCGDRFLGWQCRAA